ncbi:peptidylprolyl isomerase [Undibacterium sp. TS12]|uniref:peptidylprolyl isomerase n=1 Tax=Undibacterium sp. TS12 TaxID=2908202 RepID=UPI001F4CD383|nr:peptidylprolyl isomerase [Undibacterium sp. TS12]MCH8620630.1 peptidylprolyl isomerase [Undibacterium sp. TS12]
MPLRFAALPAVRSVIPCLLAGLFLSSPVFAKPAKPKNKVVAPQAPQTPQASKFSFSDLVKNSSATDWRPLNPENTLYLELEKGRVVIELAPDFAPKNIENIKTLVREGYFDGLAIVRSQENYVVQWADPDEKREIKKAKQKLDGEFTVKYAANLPFTRLPDADGYAPQVGHANGFAAGRDPRAGTAWLAHCYASVGVARGSESNSGNGTSLYVVTGHAPRQLDRNITVVGRVMQGMELLTTLPRGTGALGFYEKPEERTPIKTIKVAADVPEAERSKLEIIRTDTTTFKNIIDAQRNRGGDWYKVPAGYIDLCNVPLPVRVQK